MSTTKAQPPAGGGGGGGGSGAVAGSAAVYKRHAAPSGGQPARHQQYCDTPADFSKVDSILSHLQQTESHDWVAEITHWSTQVCYLLLQNYNIARLSFQSYNFHLIFLTTLFFAQRIWFFLWRVTQFSDAHGLRFACHLTLFLVLLDSLYCALQLVIRDTFFASVYLVLPLLLSILFYQWYLKSQTNVFTAELFNMLSRCMYHSLETAYCIGVLPLRFLRYEYIYYDLSRCALLTAISTAHIFLSLLCLELHCLGSEALQQTRMLGEWRRITDLATKTPKKPTEWSCHSCPYPRGAIVRCKGRYYEAMAFLNTSMPTCPRRCILPIAFVLGDAKRAKALILGALLVLNVVLFQLVLWSNQWVMYAIMIVPNTIHFLYVKCRKSHSFFNPAHLNLRQLQWDLNIDVPQSKIAAGESTPFGGGFDRGWADGLPGDSDFGHGRGYGQSLGADDCVQCPNPLFMSAISASTSFFFGPAGSPRYPDLATS
eukprot:TRINITY_DN23823_c0_g1_i1.p1 TRINITY_DN23823_c0_g1~~TRINITY_DN23823_c0_g1_i1.p1  ORF type:complete len:485 (+),score=58.78 TRINITY_DN23823_c0_g1_i1:33-1487(+)